MTAVKMIAMLALALGSSALVDRAGTVHTATFGSVKVSITLPRVVDVSGGRDSAYADASVTISGQGIRAKRFALNPMISNDPKATAFQFGLQYPDIMIEETTGFPENGGTVLFDPDYFAYDASARSYYQVRRYGGWFPSEPAVPREINPSEFVPGKLTRISNLAVIPRELGLSETADFYGDLVRVADAAHQVYLIDHYYPTQDAMKGHAVAYRAGDCMITGTWNSGISLVHYAAMFVHKGESRIGMRCG